MNLKRWPLHIWLFTALVVSLYLPYFFSSLSIALFVIYAVVKTRYRRPGERFTRRYGLPILFTLYFLVALLSVLYSDNRSEGWQALGNMLSFLVVPWAIVSFSVAEQQQMLRGASRWFILSTLLVSIYFFGAFLFLNTGVLLLQLILPAGLETSLDIELLSVRQLSTVYMHPGYLSLYLGIAVMMSISRFTASRSTWKSLYFVCLAVLFFTLMFFLQSRMTVFALIFVAMVYLISLPRYRKIAFPAVFAVILLSWLAIRYAPEELAGRYGEFKSLEYEKDDQDFNGITVRLAIWDEVLSIIREQPVLGTGLGDYRQEIVDRFRESGFNKGILSRLDPHNQYLSTWVAMGLPGLLTLILIFYLLIVPSYRRGQRLAFAVSLFFALSAISESILIRHWGIVMLSSLVFLRAYIPIRKKEEYAIEKTEE
mgnify:CR=1 FL=1